jgi:putative iron-regulated protein
LPGIDLQWQSRAASASPDAIAGCAFGDPAWGRDSPWSLYTGDDMTKSRLFTGAGATLWLALGSTTVLAGDAQLDQVIETNARIAHAVYEDALLAARELQATVDELVAKPSEASLIRARAAWLTAREPYGQSEVYRFTAGPIDAVKDDGTMGEDGDGPEGRINAWPLGEALIDYTVEIVDGDEGPESQETVARVHGNIIADPSIEISKTSLAKMNELGGDERNVTTGYHAIEFLLWGQDLNLDGKGMGRRDASAGTRPHTDYVTGQGCTHGNCDRRGRYLQAVTGLLVDDLERIVAAWDPNKGAYYKTYVAGGKDSLRKILEGMGRLSYGELAGERILIALVANSQEDEHSCFSDNTHRDILLDFKGIQNVYEGVYVRLDGTVIDGPGVRDYLAKTDPKLAERLGESLARTMSSINTLVGLAEANVPFDVQIQDRAFRPDVKQVVVNLRNQAYDIEAAMKALGVSGDLRQDTEQNLEGLT